MTLVTYSESEESDTSPVPPTKVSKDKIALNTSFRKFVSPDGHKVKVGIASSQQTSVRDEHTTGNTPSLKKRRFDDPASAKGFNALLPPPKHVNTKPVSLEKEIPRTQIVSSFSLRTASEPAFDRKTLPTVAASGSEATVSNGCITDTQNSTDVDENGVTIAAETSDAANKTIDNHLKFISSSKSTIFKPLSVARKPLSKRRLANGVAKQPETELSSKRMIDNESKPIDQTKKVSLFSLNNADTNAIYDTSSMECTENLSVEQLDQKELNDGTVMNTGPKSHDSDIENSLNGAGVSKNSLLAIAEDLNLPKSARIQLLGRHHSKSNNMSDLSAINVVNFNTDHEYAANEELRAAGETIQHNPVRSIAPGKHSLRQLVSSATTQKDALEEHFASGRRNRKEAGGKYGW